MDSLAGEKIDENERPSDEGSAVGDQLAADSRQSEGSLYLLRAPRDENDSKRQRINAKLLKVGVLGAANVTSKSEDAAMDALLKAKVVRLDNKSIQEIDGLELVDKVERLHLQSNYIKKIENLDFHLKLTWLNLGDNFITKIENLKHLSNLRVLDLSLNNISTENADFSNLPSKKLAVLNMYGNPCSNIEENPNYRSSVHEALPKLLSLDGGRMDIDVTTLTEGGEEDEEAEEDDDESMFQCDDSWCGRSIIYGTRFKLLADNDGETGEKVSKEIDLCAGCAYYRALANQGSQTKEQIRIAQNMRFRMIDNKPAHAQSGHFAKSVLQLDMEQQKTRENFKIKRSEIRKRANERLQKLKAEQEAKLSPLQQTKGAIENKCEEKDSSGLSKK